MYTRALFALLNVCGFRYILPCVVRVMQMFVLVCTLTCARIAFAFQWLTGSFTHHSCQDRCHRALPPVHAFRRGLFTQDHSHGVRAQAWRHGIPSCGAWSSALVALRRGAVSRYRVKRKACGHCLLTPDSGCHTAGLWSFPAHLGPVHAGHLASEFLRVSFS